MRAFFADPELVRGDVLRALAEDVGSGDISAALMPASQLASARIITREPCVLSGQAWAEAAFEQVAIRWHAKDGELLAANALLCELHGSARALLTSERTALNFLQTLSGTATITAHYVHLVAGTGCRILDTRKTLPGLRYAQKYAVRCGGGFNHRIGLFDAFLLKENHLAAAGSIAHAVQRARAAHPDKLLEVEVETFSQLEQCLSFGVPRVLLDNFSPQQAAEAVKLVAGRLELEASGGIDEASLQAYARAGVDFISVGALTKHVRAIDLSMRFEPALL